MSNRRKPNPSVAALEPYLLRLHEWNRRLDTAELPDAEGPNLDRPGFRTGVVIGRIRKDMDRGELAHDHLSDDELIVAIRRMDRISRRLPTSPGIAADRLLGAMRL